MHKVYSRQFFLSPLVPKELKDLLIPNPLNKRHEFPNKLLYELFESSYELMAPVQFMDYFTNQQIHQWKLSKTFKRLQYIVYELPGRESKSGNAINIRKYSNEKGDFLPKDVKRAENSISYLQDHLEKLSSFKDTITDHRSNLFDKDSNVKPWQANELAFYDTILKDILKSRVPLKPPSLKLLPHVDHLNANFSQMLQIGKRKNAKKKNKGEQI